MGSVPVWTPATVPAGTQVTYCYEVLNTGDTTLSNMQVTDNVLGAMCTIPVLAPNASQNCTKAANVTQDTVNVGTVTGQPSARRRTHPRGGAGDG